MNTTSHSHDNVTNWRKLADQLTPSQVAAIESLEREPEVPYAALLRIARDEVERNLVKIQLADVPAPSGARVEDWQRGESGNWSRSVVWDDIPSAATFALAIDGRQDSTGEFTRQITVYADEATLATGDEARALAADLLAAADKLDDLAR